MSTRSLHRRLFLAGTLLGLIAAGSSSCSNSTSPSGGVVPPHDVLIVPGASTAGSLAFSPNPFTTTIAAGGVVSWANGDVQAGSYGSTGTTHHLVSDTPLFDTGLLAAFARAQFTFTTPGTYTYHCAIHPTMVGTITINP
jgi:plastocyanin